MKVWCFAGGRTSCCSSIYQQIAICCAILFLSGCAMMPSDHSRHSMENTAAISGAVAGKFQLQDGSEAVLINQQGNLFLSHHNQISSIPVSVLDAHIVRVETLEQQTVAFVAVQASDCLHYLMVAVAGNEVLNFQMGECHRPRVSLSPDQQAIYIDYLLPNKRLVRYIYKNKKIEGDVIKKTQGMNVLSQPFATPDLRMPGSDTARSASGRYIPDAPSDSDAQQTAKKQRVSASRTSSGSGKTMNNGKVTQLNFKDEAETQEAVHIDLRK